MKFMHGSKTGGETAEFLAITIVSHERCFMKREKKKKKGCVSFVHARQYFKYH